MSADRDKNQKVAFVYQNIYHLYKKTTSEAQVVQRPLSVDSKRRVLKTEDLRNPNPSSPVAVISVSPYTAREFSPTRKSTFSLPGIPEANASHREALSSLKDNLRELQSLHGKLKFMLEELEDLVRE